MKDRIVEHPNRYKLKPVDGENGVYDLEPMPGVVTDVGTALNKETLLSDETANMYGVSTPNKVFEAVCGDNYTLFHIPLVYPNGDVVEPGIKFAITDGSYTIQYVTDGIKKIAYFLLSPGKYNLTVDQSTVPLGLVLSNVTMVALVGQRGKILSLFPTSPPQFPLVIDIKTSGTYKLSRYISGSVGKCRAFLINGGARGSGGDTCNTGGGRFYGGNGGNGGNFVFRDIDVSALQVSTSVIIGGGNSGVTSLDLGGTKITGNDDGTTGKPGGSGGTNVIPGGKSGSNGVYAFNGWYGGGGGGGAYSDGYSSCSGASGGTGGGGSGGKSTDLTNGWNGISGLPGSGNTGAGGGGGGASGWNGPGVTHGGYGQAVRKPTKKNSNAPDRKPIKPLKFQRFCGKM